MSLLQSALPASVSYQSHFPADNIASVTLGSTLYLRSISPLIAQDAWRAIGGIEGYQKLLYNAMLVHSIVDYLQKDSGGPLEVDEILFFADKVSVLESELQAVEFESHMSVPKLHAAFAIEAYCQLVGRLGVLCDSYESEVLIELFEKLAT